MMILVRSLTLILHLTFHLRSPTGGLAYGTPRKLLMVLPLDNSIWCPSTGPYLVSTTTAWLVTDATKQNVKTCNSSISPRSYKLYLFDSLLYSFHVNGTAFTGNWVILIVSRVLWVLYLDAQVVDPMCVMIKRSLQPIATNLDSKYLWNAYNFMLHTMINTWIIDPQVMILFGWS